MASFSASSSGPPSIPHNNTAIAQSRKKPRREDNKKPPPPPIIMNPRPIHLLQGPETLIASQLPQGFPPELAYRALAAYSLIRTLSIELRLSPFTPNVFLRALMLPYPNRLLGQVHVALLRVLLPALKMGYAYRERGGSLCVSKRRRVDGVWWDLRGGDNLTYLDGLTWPLFYDDYVHLTADHLWALMNDNQIHYNSRSTALAGTTEEDEYAESDVSSERKVTLRGNGTAFPSRVGLSIPGSSQVAHSPLKPRRPKTEQISPPTADSDSDAAMDTGSEFDGSDVEEEDDDDDDEEYGVNTRKTRPRGRTGRPRGRPRKTRPSAANGSSSISSVAPKAVHLTPGSQVIDEYKAVSPGVFVRLPVQTSPMSTTTGNSLPKPSARPANAVVKVTRRPAENSGTKRTPPAYSAQQQVQSAIPSGEPSAKKMKTSFTYANVTHAPLPPAPVLPTSHLQGQVDTRFPLPYGAIMPNPNANGTLASKTNPNAASSGSPRTGASQLSQPPGPQLGGMRPVPGYMCPPYVMPQPYVPLPYSHMTTTNAPAVQSPTKGAYSRIVAGIAIPIHRAPKPAAAPVAPTAAPVASSWKPELNVKVEATHSAAPVAAPVASPWKPKLNVKVKAPELPVLEKAEQNVEMYTVASDVADSIHKFHGGDGDEENYLSRPIDSKKDSGEVSASSESTESPLVTLRQCDKLTNARPNRSIEMDPTPMQQEPSCHDPCDSLTTDATSGNTESNNTKVPSVETDEHDESFVPPAPDEWSQFTPIKAMRKGVSYHRLPLEEKLRILEFLLDELLTAESVCLDFNGRQQKTSPYYYPYGALPSKQELETLCNEDQCGLCGKEGELVCCDGCIRSYHTQCIGLATGSRLPDKWLCPECSIVDPCRFGPLWGGHKASLDWFTLQDLEAPTKVLPFQQEGGISSSQSTHSTGRLSASKGPVESDLDEKEFLVVHGFVFTRPASRFRDGGREHGLCHYLPASQNDLYRILQKIGPDMCFRWPFSQIPMDATTIWKNVNEPRRAQQMACYFSHLDSFNPSAYLNRYRMAPLSRSMQAKGSKNTVFLLSEYESECSSSDVRVLRRALSRDMSHDIGISRSLRSSTLLFDPYEMITSFVLRLEGSLRRGRLLDENWGIRNGIFNPEKWHQEIIQCRSIKKLARKVVNLIDACHVRIFADGWTELASTAVGSKTLMRDTGMSSASTDGRRYETLPNEWTAEGEMARRRWQRSRDSNILSLLSRESFHLDGSAHTAESVALKFERTKRKNDATNKHEDEVQKDDAFEASNDIEQPSGVEGFTSESLPSRPSAKQPSSATDTGPENATDGIATSSEMTTSTLAAPCGAKESSSMGTDEAATSRKQSTETNELTNGSCSTQGGGASAQDSSVESTAYEESEQSSTLSGASSLQPTVLADEKGVGAVEDSSQASLGQRSGREFASLGDPAKHTTNEQVSKGESRAHSSEGKSMVSEKVEQKMSVVMEGKQENEFQTKSYTELNAAQTKRPKKKRSERTSEVKRRSGRLHHRHDFSDQIDTLVAGSDQSSEVSTGQSIHHNGDQFGHAKIVDRERKNRLVRLEELVVHPSETENHWPVAGRKLFDPVGYLPPSEMRRLGRNAGLVTAQFVRYTTYEVGEVSAYHAWRKRMLRVYSLEDLIIQLRVLNSFIDKQTMYSCESLARRALKAKEQVQKRVICKQRDLKTGSMAYFVVNEGRDRRRGCWVTSGSIDLSALILERSNCIDKKLEKCEQPNRQAELPMSLPGPKETVQVPNSSSSKGLPLVARVTIAKCNSDMAAIIVEHGVDTGRLFLHCRELGSTTLFPTQIRSFRVKNILRLKEIFRTLEQYGHPPRDEGYIMTVLSEAERAALGKFDQLERLYQPQTVASRASSGLSVPMPFQFAGVGGQVQPNFSAIPTANSPHSSASQILHQPPIQQTLQQPRQAPNQNALLQRRSPVEQSIQQLEQLPNQQLLQQQKPPIPQTLHDAQQFQQFPNHHALVQQQSPSEQTLQQMPPQQFEKPPNHSNVAYTVQDLEPRPNEGDAKAELNNQFWRSL